MGQIISSFTLTLLTSTPAKHQKYSKCHNRPCNVPLKNNKLEVSILNIILRTDNTNLNEKGCLVIAS